MSIRDIILESRKNIKHLEPSLDIQRCITVNVDYPDSAAVYARPGFSWVKEYGQSRIYQVFNPIGNNAVDLPVLVYRLPKPPFMKAIYGIDWETLNGNLTTDIGQGGGAATNPNGTGLHAVTHEWADGYQGNDALRVYMRSLANMQAYVSSGMIISILPGIYVYNDTAMYFPGGTVNMIALLPASGKQIRILIYYDTSDYSIKTQSSAEVALNAFPEFEYAPKRMIPLAWVLLKYGDTALTEERLTDARFLYSIKGLHATDHNAGGDDEVSASDSAAIHDNVSGEINAITGKDTPVSDDVILIEDSAASYAKKKVLLSNLPGSSAVNQQVVFTVDGELEVVSGTLRIPNVTGRTLTMSKVYLIIDTAPVDASIIVDIHKDGTTIFTTQGNRPAITTGNTTGQSTSLDVTSWADGSYLTMDVDQIGSTTAGSNLTVVIVYQ
jgi:hypothetical protein